MTQLTKVAGEYLQPAWAPDGRELVVTRGTGGFLRQHSVSNNAWYELRRIGANGEFEQRVTDVNRPYVASRPGMPRRPIVQAWYGPDGRIFYPETHGNLPARGGTVIHDERLPQGRAHGGDHHTHRDISTIPGG